MVYTLSDEEKELFSSMMSLVKPLKSTKSITKISHNTPIHHEPYAINYYARDVDFTQNTNISSLNYDCATVSADTILSYYKCIIPRNRINKLKHGKIPFQAKLDLHGLRVDAAHAALCQFIDKYSHSSKRCLLLIHGKGSKNGENPVLKNHVNNCLRQFPEVLAFHSALARDGGAGALYILLQRPRLSMLK